MKVKANWPVDTGKDLHPTGAEFDVSPKDARALEAAGAVEIVGRKKAETEEPDDPEGGGAGQQP
ncbi:hypothetical protein [Cupriavidus sp.]|uniref:hypothetical protein n=1 Tax=Cupriavidus sp. TaxID=1873897 RepID=UPI003D0B898E